MSKQASPALIGTFVIGAVALAVVGILLFGSGRFFRNATRFVIFFPGTVDGLSVGAPVKFKGVEIGSVTDIRIRIAGGPPPTLAPGVTTSQAAEGVRIPVFVDIDNDKVTSLGGDADLHDGSIVRALIGAGLRAQLATQSLVTGLLFVQLDFHPDAEATYVLGEGSTPPEIPAIPSTVEQIQNALGVVIKKLEGMDIDQVIKAAVGALDGVNRLANAPGLHQSVEALPATVAKLDEAVTAFRTFATNLDQRSGPIMEGLKVTVESTRVALEQARTTFDSMEQTVGPNSAVAASLQASLRDVSDAARSVRLLADYLERNPSALLRGRGEAGK